MEQELRTKRIVGELLKSGKETGEIAKPGEYMGNQHEGSSQPEPPKTISELGLSKKQSASFQKIASIPEEEFEEHIAEAKSEVETASFLKSEI